METEASPLVFTKLSPPVSRQRAIPRERLMARLSTEDAPGFTLVCAAAGYGKTTLLADWARRMQQSGTLTAWVALDENDDSPITFAAYLAGSLIQALGPRPELTRLAQALRSSTEIDPGHVIAVIINAVMAAGQKCVLILDDYHLITSPAIHTSVAYLLEHLPGNMRVVIGSRSDPPLPLARLRARGAMLELRAADLRFTRSEAAAFLNDFMQLGLPEEDIAALETRTEGWVTGLQLAGLSLLGQPDNAPQIDTFGGSHRYLVEYLLDEVVNRQTAGVQAFLLATSLLERLCAPLCQAVTPADASTGEMLDQLEQANLFVIALDDQSVWYRYHHLFRDFLQARLRKTQPESVPGIHRLACEWLAEHGYLREAARHAFQEGDWEYAAAFVEKHSFTLILHSDIATIHEWCLKFPEEVMLAHPLLCIHQCWALALSFKKKNRARVESRLQQAANAASSLTDPGLRSQIAETSVIIRTFMAMAPDPAEDAHATLAEARAMLDGYQSGDPGRFSALLLSGYAMMALHDARGAAQAFETARQIALAAGLYFGVVESTFNLARLAHHQGDLSRAVELCLESKAALAAMLKDPEQEVPAVGALDVAMGCTLLEQNHLREAEDSLLHGLGLLSPGMNPSYTLAACTALARLREIQGRLPEADAYLNQLDEAWPDISFYTDGLRVAMALRAAQDDAANREKAAAWCQKFAADYPEEEYLPGVGPFGGADVFYQARLARAYMLIRLGMGGKVSAYLERQRHLAAANGLQSRVIELSLLQALAAEAVGEKGIKKPAAAAALDSALAAGEPGSFVRVYDVDPVLRRMLARAARRGPYRQSATRILTALDAPVEHSGQGARSEAVSSVPRTEAGIIESLSAREVEVLRLVAQGATNQDIADRLVITVGTTKSHINHILGKLNAANRTEAVARGRQFGLI